MVWGDPSSEKLKEERGTVEQLQAQMWNHTEKVSQQVSYSVCELQNGYCFILALHVLHKSVWFILTGNRGKGVLGNVVQSSQVDISHSTQWLSQYGGIPGDLYFIFLHVVFFIMNMYYIDNLKKYIKLFSLGKKRLPLLQGIIRIKR